MAAGILLCFALSVDYWSFGVFCFVLFISGYILFGLQGHAHYRKTLQNEGHALVHDIGQVVTERGRLMAETVLPVHNARDVELHGITATEVTLVTVAFHTRTLVQPK